MTPNAWARTALRDYWGYLAVPVVFGLDQSSKNWAEGLFGGVWTLVPGFFAFRLLHNQGGPLGFLPGPDWTAWPVKLLWLGLLLGLVYVALKTRKTKKMRHLGFACMIGGAMGNAWDRWVRGYVVDFVELWIFPVFNVADLLLWTGVLLAGLDLILSKRRES